MSIRHQHELQILSIQDQTRHMAEMDVSRALGEKQSIEQKLMMLQMQLEAMQQDRMTDQQNHNSHLMELQAAHNEEIK